MASLFQRLFGKSDKRVLVGGLDASGKTTLLYKLKLGEIVTTIPTIGFNVETITYNRTDYTMWDVGGCDKIRPLYRHYFSNVSAFILMVDSNDRERISEAKDDILTMIVNEVPDVPILVMANKQDLPKIMSMSEISDKLGLHAIRNRPWHILPSCATSGDGLYEGLEWLDKILKNPRPTLSAAPPSTNPALTTTPTPSTQSVESEEKARLFMSWLQDDGLADDDFISKFKKGDYSPQGASTVTVTGEVFTHRTFLRVLWTYLKVYGRRETMKRAFTDLTPYVMPYNETLLYFWTHMIHYSIESIRNPDGQFASFLLLNPVMMDAAVLQDTYYSRDLLHSAGACKAVVLPDKKPLPSMIPKAYSPVQPPTQTPPTTGTASPSVSTTTTTTTTTIATNSSQPSPSPAHPDITFTSPSAPIPSTLIDNDDTFLERFERADLDSWDHRTHLRMAWLYLTRFGRREGVNKIFDGIKNFIANSRVSRRTTFHFTMTYFWIQMVDCAINSSPQGLTFDQFMDANPQLMNGGLFLEYYKKETMLNNPTARSEMVLPDIKPLPSFIPKKK